MTPVQRKCLADIRYGLSSIAAADIGLECSLKTRLQHENDNFSFSQESSQIWIFDLVAANCGRT